MQIYSHLQILNNYKLYLSLNNTGKKYCETYQKETCLVLKSPKSLSDLFNEFNNSSDQNKNQENASNCKYYDLNEIRPLNKLNNKSSLSLFHSNTCSLSKHFEDLKYLLDSTNLNFDVIAISETRITKNEAQINHIDLTKYSYEYCPTESSAGGTLLYIRNHLSYKTRNDLNIYKSGKLESTFIEIINHKKSNILVGCIYRHPVMDLNEFNDHYVNELLHKLSSESKSFILLGDFRVDLMKYDNHQLTNELFDSLSSHLLLPHITQPTRIRDSSKTLIDNIFSNTLIQNIISGNLTATISDHLPQFVILPNIFSNPPSNKSNIYERECCAKRMSNVVQENFILDYFFVDWNSLTNNDKDINLSFNNFLKRTNAILENHAPLRKVTKKKLRFRSKP